MANRSAGVALAALVGWTIACGGLTPTPVPADKADYIGDWTGGPVTLDIEASGSVHYVKDAGVHTEINAPIQAWHEGSFDVGIGPASTTFTVTDPPHTDGGGTWTMTVDGQVLTRPGPPAPDDGPDGPGRKAKAGKRGR